MTDLLIDLWEIDAHAQAFVGGKAANLGALARIDTVRVPPGWCLTTVAFDRFMEAAEAQPGELLAAGTEPDPQQPDFSRSCADLRGSLQRVRIPDEVVDAVTVALATRDRGTRWAVRSSSTAEDLATASFAGQHDTLLNVDADDVLDAVRTCWVSLFTDRAVAYRAQHDIDPRSVRMAVVIQEMLDPDISGVMFTADPPTGNRKIVTIEAVPGLGDALVSGTTTPATYTVSGDQQPVRHERADATATDGKLHLTDQQVRELARLGRTVEARFGTPQDIEWCLVGDAFWVVQSRPITTLFPPPETDRPGNRVYVSVGHQQMMTDAMKALGLSVWQLTSRAPMTTAGSRLFVDVTDLLSAPTTRQGTLAGLSASDPLLGHALQQLVDRDGFLPEADGPVSPASPPGTVHEDIDLDPAVVPALVAREEASFDELDRRLDGLEGNDLLDAIADDIKTHLREVLFGAETRQAVMGAIQAARWLNEQLGDWLGVNNPADTLAQSVDHNVTAQMGLALMDVADQVRPHPQVIAYLEAGTEPGWIDELTDIPGGDAAAAAIRQFLDSYGFRCAGEIDITRPRWHEQPDLLIPTILNNVRRFRPGAATERFERGRARALRARDELLARLEELPGGDQKAAEAARMIDHLRGFSGYREYPKFAMVRRYDRYRQAILDEADRLTAANVIRSPEDVYHLTFDELRRASADGEADLGLVAERRAAFLEDQRLTPPRVITADGEVVTGTYSRTDVPDGALIGLAVSSGEVEGRARVVATMADADLGPGDILVTSFTDPSWTPAFLAAAGLVTEVGGLMTHGAVIAREYGLPAVVGVRDATTRLRDGQPIRVDGTNGLVIPLAKDTP